MENNKQQVIELIAQLNEITSLTGKQKLEYLKTQPLHSWLKTTLDFVFNKFIQTGISSKTLLNPDDEFIDPTTLGYKFVLNGFYDGIGIDAYNNF